MGSDTTARLSVPTDQTPGEAGQSGTGGRLRGILADLMTASGHSSDFTATRNEHIRARLAVVQLLFAIGFIAWIPVDYFMFAWEQARGVTVARVVLALTLLGLWQLNRRAIQDTMGERLIAATVLALAVFHAVSIAMLSGTAADELLGGYRALPFVLIVLTALFPVPLSRGVSLIAMVLALFVAVELYQGTLLTMRSANTLWMLALVSGVVLWVQGAQLQTQLQLHREASRDPLTGLSSRRVFQRALRRMRRACQRQDERLSVLGIQLDQVEQLQGEYDNEQRDGAIQRLAEVIRSQYGASEQVCRQGGSLFLVALPGSNPMEAIEGSEHLRRALRRHTIAVADGDQRSLTASVGVSECAAGDASTDDVISRVERAVWKAQNAGGDRATTE